MVKYSTRRRHLADEFARCAGAEPQENATSPGLVARGACASSGNRSNLYQRDRAPALCGERRCSGTPCYFARDRGERASQIVGRSEVGRGRGDPRSKSAPESAERAVVRFKPNRRPSWNGSGAKSWLTTVSFGRGALAKGVRKGRARTKVELTRQGKGTPARLLGRGTGGQSPLALRPRDQIRL